MSIFFLKTILFNEIVRIFFYKIFFLKKRYTNYTSNRKTSQSHDFNHDKNSTPHYSKNIYR